MDQIGDKNDDTTWLEEIAVKEAISNLSDREKRILTMRFFRGKTQMEVASEIGISQAQVSRIEKGALDRIKKNILSRSTKILRHRCKVAEYYLIILFLTRKSQKK